MIKKSQISKNNISIALLGDIRKMINDSRLSVAVTVNAALTQLYWRIGKRIKEDVLRGERAEYGKEIVVSLSRQLVSEYGNSFSEKNLRRMIQFAEVFPSEEIVVSLIRQLSWTHFLERSLSNGIFTLKCAVWKAGAFVRSGKRLTPCSTIELSRQRLSGGHNVDPGSDLSS